MMPASNFMAGVRRYFISHAWREDNMLLGNGYWCFESKLRRSPWSLVGGN